jgi:rhamnulokinase
VELPHPVISDAGLAANFTNEGGLGGTIRFLANIMGLWLLQECRRAWGGNVGYEELMREAMHASPFRSILNPDQQRFYRPLSMPEEIAACCRDTGQPVPSTRGEFTRCILESLALKSRFALDQVCSVLGRPRERIHIIGGGSRNTFLCQATANATGLPVTAGPVEGTAIGNLLVQGMATGIITSHAEGREMVRRSFTLQEYVPADREQWEQAYVRFRPLVH